MSKEPNPQQLLEEIEECKDKLRTLNTDYTDARRVRAVTLQAYEKEVSKIYTSFLSPEWRKEHGLEKMPAEDMRKAMAHALIDETVWSGYLSAEADLDALDRNIKIEQTILTGIQSELQQLRVELANA